VPTLHETVERYYTCPRCGAKGEVAFTASGRGNAIDGTSLFIRLFAPRRYWSRAADLPALDAVSRAGAAQRQDAERTLGVIRCPACGKRPLGAFVWPAFRIALITALGLFLTSLRFYLVGLPWWSGGAVFAAVQVVIEIRRFHRAARVATLKLVAPPHPLPSARVVAAPHTAPPKLEPLVAFAPPPTPPPGDVPRFLKDV
jgi:uncharacterized protein (UPF0212 family)